MIAVITARGGSKGLPNKNIMSIAGLPLIAHTIIAAKNAEGVERVIVSTDDLEIARISKVYGAEVPFIRPAELATDLASSMDVLYHCLSWFKEFENLTVENLVLLQPTSPLRNTQHINEAIMLFTRNKAQSVISFVEDKHPIYWSKFIEGSGVLKDIFPVESIQRQAYKKTFHPNGAIYVLKGELIFNKNSLYTEETYAYVMDHKCSIDIDTLEDFEYAEYLMSRTNV